ncbi:MAG: cytochrome c oxidase subunit II [Gammaproteobacteria bacterium]|jgi:cytochrome c oxidase subunit 2
MNGLVPYIEAASRSGSEIDALLLALTLLSGLVVGGISLLIVVFAVRYRRGSRAPRGNAPARDRRLEFVWITLPLLVFLAIFYWAARLYADLRTAPPDALELSVIAKQWMWKVQHPDGQREIDTLHIPVDRPVKLVMTSQDVIHSFYVPAFRVKQDVLPGRYTMLWFEATRTGEYPLLCAEFCGTGHSRMRGSVVVMTDAAYSRWLAANPGPGSLANQGEALFRSHGCSGCHGENATVHAPKLAGLYGTRIPLADGSSVTVDDRYIRDSILLPASEVAAGYAPLMPSFQGQLDESDIMLLVAYIRSLGEPGEPSP